MRKLGSQSICEVAGGECTAELKESEDITSSILALKSIPTGPALPCLAMALQKSAITAFQSWHCRNPGIIGLLLGSQQAKRSVCNTIVVGTNWDELLAHANVMETCKEHEFFMGGAILGPQADSAGEIALMNKCRDDLGARGCEVPAMVFAACHC